MKGRIGALLALVVALAVVDTALAWLDRSADRAREVSTGDRLKEFDAAGVARVILAREGRPPVVLARSLGGAWVVATAKSFPARKGKVDQILARIRGWQRDRIAGDARNHDAFGVTRAKGVSVKVEDFAGQTVAEVLVGSLTGIDPEEARARGGKVDTSRLGRYMRLADEESVYVVLDFVTGELEPDLQEWLDRPITGGDETKARAIAIRRRTGEQVTILLDPPFPRLATPDQRPVDGDRAKALVHEVLQAYATDLTEGDDAAVGLQSPLVTAEVVFSDGSPSAKLLLGDAAPPSSKTNPSYAARVPDKPGPLLVPQAAVAQLVSATSENVTLAHVFGERTASSLTRVSLGEGGRAITIERDPKGAWTVTAVGSGVAAATRPLESEPKRQRALAAALALPAAGFDRMGLSGHGLIAPALTLSIETSNKERFELVLGAREGAYVWVRRQDLPCAIAVPAEAVAELKAAFAYAAE